MATKSLMGLIEFGGRKLEPGNYTVIIKELFLKENVSIYDERLPKEICMKEQDTLTEAQIKMINDLDLGDKGVFQDGSPKPRFQNQTIFVFAEKESGKAYRFDTQFWGGPAIASKLAEFVQQITGYSSSELARMQWEDITKMEFTASIYDDGKYDHIAKDTIRRVGLPPVTNESKKTENNEKVALTEKDRLLIKYFNDEGQKENDGKGVLISSIPTLHKNGIVIDNMPINSFDEVISSWKRIKTVATSISNDGVHILVTE
jgi:hypothetical protein